MRDLGAKMAELKFEAPLAQFEDEWSSGNEFVNANNNSLKTVLSDTININLKDLTLNDLETGLRDAHLSKNGTSPNCNTSATTINDVADGSAAAAAAAAAAVENFFPGETFTETFSGSLEDLVNTFDEKITKCFGNFEENVEELAPVQVRSQEEIMNECQMWWTITGNFGNILPIDWSKSYARQLYLPTLNIQEKRTKDSCQTPEDEINDLSSEDEAVANDLDMHALILNGLNPEIEEPIKTADEVIKEIENIIDETNESDGEIIESEVMEKAKEVLGAPLYEEKLQSLTMSQLNELYMEMEILIREFSETLIHELALRDELEYEKELKNTFISLLLAVQNKRRQYHVEKKRGKLQGKPSIGLEPKYLTTVIPYHLENGAPDNQALQVLIKILKAINDNSPTVPTLLTDYILKVLCPT